MAGSKKMETLDQSIRGAIARRARLVVAILCAALALAAYLPTANYEFVYDDHRYIELNPQVHDPSGIITGFATPFPPTQPQLGQYRPLFTATLAFDYALADKGGGRSIFGLEEVSAKPFHVTNILLHALTTLVFVMLVGSIAGSGRSFVPMAAGALYAVHPVHVEAVANVTGRAEVQMTLFYLMAAWMLWRHPTGAAWSRAPWLWGAVAAFAAALFTKESAVTFPLVAILLIFFKPALPKQADVEAAVSPTPSRWALLLPLAAVGLLYLAARFWATEAAGPSPENAYFRHHPDQAKWPTMSFIFLLYNQLLLLPTHFNADYEIPVFLFHTLEIGPIGTWANPWALAGLLLLVAWIALFVVSVLRRSEWALPMGLFLIPLAIYSHALEFGDLAGERFLYLPSAGLCWAAALALERLRGPALRNGILAVLLALLLIRALAQLPAWRSPESFYAFLMRASPVSAEPYFGLAQRHHQRAQALRAELPDLARREGPRLDSALEAMTHEFDEAERLLRAALERDPNHLKARLSLHTLLLSTLPPRQEQAIEHYRWIVENAFWRMPDMGDLWMSVAEWHLGRKEYVEALRHVRAALHAYHPNKAQVRSSFISMEAKILNEWGIQLAAEGRLREAYFPLRRAASLHPDIRFARNLAVVLEEMGELETALQQWSQLVRRQPQNAEFRAAVERVYSKLAERRASGDPAPIEPPTSTEND